MKVKLAGVPARVHVRSMADLSRVGEIVRRHDPDRFFTALFAPAARRETLFVLYAFNHELARAREVAREPMMALMRLQWWREVVEGARRQHEVAGPLGKTLDAGLLQAGDLLSIIDAREAETAPIETVGAWREYVLGTAGGVAVAAGHALGAATMLDWALRCYGAAYGVSGILRAAPALARQGRSVLPPELAGDVDAVAAEGVRFLAEARCTRLPRVVRPAAMPAALADSDFRRPHSASGPRSGLSRVALLTLALLQGL